MKPAYASLMMALVLALPCSAGMAARSAIADGYFDASWAGGGRIVLDGAYADPARGSHAKQVIVEPNGNLLIGGDTHDSGWWWLGELQPGGSPALLFGESNGSGLVAGCRLSPALCEPTSTFGNQFSAMSLQPDGRIVVAGSNTIARVLPGGHAMDDTGVVGGNGYVTINDTVINNAGGKLFHATAMAPATSGKWLVAGPGSYTGIGTQYGMSTIRLNADFSLDTSYNATTDENGVSFNGGQFIESPGGSVAIAILRQKDGRFLLANAMGAIRLAADGQRDLSYNVDITDIFPDTANSQLRATLDSMDRLVIAGTSPLFQSPVLETAIVRILPDGSRDLGFGNAGVARLPDDGSHSYYSHSVAMDSAGRILIAGERTDAASGQFFVARFFGDTGQPDTRFGINGISYGTFVDGNRMNTIHDIVFDGSGKPVVIGSTHAQANSDDPFTAAVGRLTYDLIYTNDFESVPRGRLPGQ